MIFLSGTPHAKLLSQQVSWNFGQSPFRFNLPPRAEQESASEKAEREARLKALEAERAAAEAAEAARLKAEEVR